MKKQLFTLMCMAGMTLFMACGNKSGNAANNENNATEESAAKAEDLAEDGYSLTFDDNGSTVVYTCKGEAKRLDYKQGEDTQSVSIYDGQTGFRYEDGTWTEDKQRAQQSINNYFSEYIMDHSKRFAANGYTKTGTTEICGKMCDVYAGQYTGPRRAMYGDMAKEMVKGEIAVWNGLTLRYKYSDVDGTPLGTTVCKNIKLNVPDRAFEKTLDF